MAWESFDKDVTEKMHSLNLERPLFKGSLCPDSVLFTWSVCCHIKPVPCWTVIAAKKTTLWQTLFVWYIQSRLQCPMYHWEEKTISFSGFGVKENHALKSLPPKYYCVYVCVCFSAGVWVKLKFNSSVNTQRNTTNNVLQLKDNQYTFLVLWAFKQKFVVWRNMGLLLTHS